MGMLDKFLDAMRLNSDDDDDFYDDDYYDEYEDDAPKRKSHKDRDSDDDDEKKVALGEDFLQGDADAPVKKAGGRHGNMCN